MSSTSVVGSWEVQGARPYRGRVPDSPIGVFDSGYGGLTVARAILDQLPFESVAYFGDTARAPYGPRPIAQTRQFALECLDRLVDHGVKVLVIACNTASAAVLHDARERYDVPVVEVIRPAVRRAAGATRNGRVGVISTLGTHQSGAYLDAFAAAPQLNVSSVPCPRFVEFVERGVTGGPELIAVAREYLAPLQERDIDTLVLGCTHYPLLTGVISYVMGDGVTLVSSAEETATAEPRLHDHRRSRGVPASGGPLPGPGFGVGRDLYACVLGGAEPDMRLTIVGCSGSYAGPASPASCYLVQEEQDGRTWSLLLDLGSGALGALQRHLDPRLLDGMVISHLHPDHCIDLTGMYVFRRYHPLGTPSEPVPVWGPPGTLARFVGMYPGIEEHLAHQIYAVGDLDDGLVLTVGPFTVTARRVRHPVEAYGFRVEANGRVLAYSGDTDSCAGLLDLLAGAHLALVDSAFVDGRDTTTGIHLSGSRAAQAALDAGGVGRLMLTHIPRGTTRRYAAPRPLPSGRARSNSRCQTRHTRFEAGGAGRAARLGLAACLQLLPAMTGARPRIFARFASLATGSTTPRARCSSNSVEPGCSAPRPLLQVCRAGSRGRAPAG